MADSYHIIDGQVVPFHGGRKDTNTDAWRDATPLELQLQEQLAEYEHATAAKDAEIEALRAEVGDYRTNGAAAVRFAPNSAYWSNELRRLFGDDARTGIEVLENQYRQELARAERLAEALREAADMLLADYPETAKRLRATLNPTAAQENDDA